MVEEKPAEDIDEPVIVVDSWTQQEDKDEVETPEPYVREIYPPISKTGKEIPEGVMIWPLLGNDVDGGTGITSGFGYRPNPFDPDDPDLQPHHGIDIAVPIGTEVISVKNGRIAEVGENDIFGYFIEIDHGNGISSFYAHLNELPQLQKGQEVSRGTVIGISGETGLSTGPHLHFEYRQNGVSMNPFEMTWGHGFVISIWRQ